MALTWKLHSSNPQQCHVLGDSLSIDWQYGGEYKEYKEYKRIVENLQNFIGFKLKLLIFFK